MKWNWLLEGKCIAIGFGLMILLIGGIHQISYRNVTRLSESTDKVAQTHEVLEALMGILASLHRAEARRYSYMLFNDPSELERHNQTVQTIESNLNQLQSLVADDVNQQQRLTALELLVAQRWSLTQQSIELYQQDSSQTDQMPLKAAVTRNRREIEKLVDQMQQQQERSLKLWIEQTQASIQRRMLMESLGTFLTFLILFTVYVLLHRQMIKRQEAELLQRQLAQEKELGELNLKFFSMVSHEFRTPLSIVVGSAQLLEEKLQPLVEPQKLKGLRRIRSAAQSMTQILADILTLARAEAGRLDYNPELVEMESFCLNLAEDVQLSMQSQHVLKFALYGQCGYAQVDTALLYSILSNLLSNAIKYSPPEGSIDFSLTCEPSSLTFQVKDEGIGIPPEALQTLYEPFQRGGNTKGISGTGLGLAVVKKYLDLHQGQIFVESEVGVGTMFTVTIPQATSAITAMQADAITQ